MQELWRKYDEIWRITNSPPICRLWDLEKIRAISSMNMKNVSISGTWTGICKSHGPFVFPLQTRPSLVFFIFYLCTLFFLYFILTIPYCLDIPTLMDVTVSSFVNLTLIRKILQNPHSQRCYLQGDGLPNKGVWFCQYYIEKSCWSPHTANQNLRMAWILCFSCINLSAHFIFE